MKINWLPPWTWQTNIIMSFLIACSLFFLCWATHGTFFFFKNEYKVSFILKNVFLKINLLMAVLALLLLRGLSLVVASKGCSLLGCKGFSLWWLLLLRSTGSWAQSQWPHSIRNPRVGRQILNHWITMDILMVLFSFDSMLLHNPAFIFAREWPSEFKTGGRGQDSVLKGLSWLWIFKLAPHLCQIPWAGRDMWTPMSGHPCGYPCVGTQDTHVWMPMGGDPYLMPEKELQR